MCSFDAISRIDGHVKLKHTTVWTTPERTDEGMVKLVFGPPTDAALGSQISSAAITAATNIAGDCSFVLGFANTEQMAKDTIDAYEPGLPF